MHACAPSGRWLPVASHDVSTAPTVPQFVMFAVHAMRRSPVGVSISTG